jgi:hypothetical protein
MGMPTFSSLYIAAQIELNEILTTTGRSPLDEPRNEDNQSCILEVQTAVHWGKGPGQSDKLTPVTWLDEAGSAVPVGKPYPLLDKQAMTCGRALSRPSRLITSDTERSGFR